MSTSGSTEAALPARVAVGAYSLEVGSAEGTFALFEPEAEDANARSLGKALHEAAEAPDEAPAALTEFVDEASSVTARSEKCLRLFNDLAQGKALDPKVVSQEIDTMLVLLGRLDRSGRHEEALRLARDLAALLALFLRWLDLVRSVRLALGTAQTLGDRAAEAWATHELGALHLAAGEPRAAAEHLQTALRIKDDLGGHGRCATRHNLDAARRDLVDRGAARGRRRRRLRRVAAGAVLGLVAAGGTALGIIIFGSHHATAAAKVIHGSGPTLTIPKRVEVEATNPGGARVSFSASVNEGAVGCVPRSGGLFRLGTTEVRCRATSAEGVTRGTFPVEVLDRTPPELQLPTSIRREVLGETATVRFPAAARDRVDGVVSVNCSPASGSSFDLGKTMVRCRTVDRHGNDASKTFLVVLARRPSGAPLISLPADMTVEATGPRGALARYAATARAPSGRALRLTCSPVSGAILSLGRHTVTCTASLPGGPPRYESFAIVVRDTTPPRLLLPGPLRLEAETTDGAEASFSASASDLVDGAVEVRCEPVSSALLAIGAHRIVCRASDRSGNAGSNGFTIVVYDAPPMLTVPENMVVAYSTVTGSPVRFSASATDRLDGPVTADCAPRSGSLFPIGTAKVVCGATDSAGNTATKAFTITVVDRVSPVLSLPKSFGVWAPYGATTYVVTFTASARDAIDGIITVECTPESGSEFAVGKTTQVECRTSDRAGNTATGRFTVAVWATPG